MKKLFHAGDPSLAKFHVGAKDLAAFGLEFRKLMDEIEAGDWGDVSAEERQQNDQVLQKAAGFVTGRKVLGGKQIVIKSEVKLHWTDVFLVEEYEQAKHLWRNA